MIPSTTRPYLWLFGILAVVGLIADQTSKYVVFAKLYPTDGDESIVPVIDGLFSLRTLHYRATDPGDQMLSRLRTISGERLPHVNKGALFGIGNDGEGLNSLFAVISILAACFIVFWTSRSAVASDRFLCIALGLILGGTLGNLFDRVVFGGVRDFLHCYYETHVWPDFNIADCCLVCGAGVLLVHSFFATESATQPETAVAEPASLQTTTPAGGM